MIHGLDLFSGIGGITLALREWVKPVAYCESDPYAQAVLLSRMSTGDLPVAPIWDDIRTLRADMLRAIDIIYGGFPCQDISVAGTGAGLDGERSGLVFELLRLVGECRPRFVFLENVPALAVRGLDRLLLELDALGYDARWTIVSAGEVGAPHLRERIWIIAHANGKRGRNESKCIRRISDPSQPRLSREERNDPDATSQGLEGGGQGLPRLSGWGQVEPSLRGSDHGISNWMDRIKGLGNAVVPHSAREAFGRLIGLNMLRSAKLSQGG